MRLHSLFNVLSTKKKQNSQIKLKYYFFNNAKILKTCLLYNDYCNKRSNKITMKSLMKFLSKK